MYAVIKTGGKQYRVTQGDKLRVESLPADEGETITIDQVLMTGDGDSVSVGTPMLENSTVTAVVLSHGRGKKVNIIKFRRRKHHRKQMGHRQNYTELQITEINGIAGDPSKSDSSAKSSTSTAAKSESKTKAKSSSDKASDAATAAAGAAAVAAAAGAASASVSGGADAASGAGAGGATGADLKFLDAPEGGTADDLTKILGIGSVLEDKLHGMGIYHYHQIAAFTDADIQNINAHLNFPGRIERDEWIPQAKELMGGGEGRALKYLDAPEGEKDDLKLISGVGPVLEDKLNNMGIYHFWQVAKFELKDIDLVNQALDFPGRIERDDWINQAKNLADGGEPR